MQIQIQTAESFAIFITGQGVAKLREHTRKATFVGGHGLDATAELNDAAPVGAIVEFRRRNDYAGKPFDIRRASGALVAELPAHGHKQVIRVQRTASGWFVIT
jgi:hypothetical protein